MNKLIVFLLIFMSTTGCSSGHYMTDFDAKKHSSMVFVGIPTVLGFGALGSTTPISPTLSLTNKHVARWMIHGIIAEHPDCDIALIRQDNPGFNSIEFDYAKIGLSIINYGYSALTALPSSSDGEITAYSLYLSSDNNERCTVGVMTNGVVAGMSGGPVEDKVGDVVGVNVAYGQFVDLKTKEKHDASFFIPYQNFKDWLNVELEKQKGH